MKVRRNCANYEAQPEAAKEGEMSNNDKTTSKYETTDAQRKNSNRGIALEWSVLGDGWVGVGVEEA